MSNTALSKSSFIKGLQCHKLLWQYKHCPELMDPVDRNLETIFQTGHAVGELATGLFPGGKMLPCDELSFTGQIETTRLWLEQGVTTIYEAAFSANGVFARVDILHQGPEGWEIYEVKSSTRPKPVYLQDVAVQSWILRQAGLTVSKTALVTLNPRYRRQGEIKVDELFAIHDLTAESNAMQAFVSAEVARMQAMLEAGPMPEVKIGHHCNSPYRCAFHSHCHGAQTDDSVFKLTDIGQPDSYALFHAGQTRYAEIDLDQLGWRQRLQVESYLHKTNPVQKVELRHFLVNLWYPLCCLDFETTHMVAVPIFDGTRPYQQVPFQFSMHIQHEPDGPVEHVAFLAEPGSDPRPALLEQLLAAIPENACVLAYNKSFEERRLKDMAQACPEYAPRLQPLLKNLRDLMVPFRNKDVYYWQMNGSYALKQVLPALVPTISYADLPIGDGEAAANAYLQMCASKDAEEIAEIRQHLLKYCELDSFAMVKLLEKLDAIAAE